MYPLKLALMLQKIFVSKRRNYINLGPIVDITIFVVEFSVDLTFFAFLSLDVT